MINPSVNPSKSYFLHSPTIAERHAYFKQLMQLCSELPYADVVETLWAEYRRHEALGYRALHDFTSRLPEYVCKHLHDDVRRKLNASGGYGIGTITQFRVHLRVLELLPENWPFWGVWERDRLAHRKQDVIERLEIAEREGRAEHVRGHAENLERIDRILAACTAAEVAGDFAVSASEIDGLILVAPSDGSEQAPLASAPPVAEVAPLASGEQVPVLGNPEDPELRKCQARVALLYVYSKAVLTKKSGVAAAYGWTSDDSVYKQFTRLSEQANRRAGGKNMLDNIKSVIGYLSTEGQNIAQLDIDKINKRLGND